MPQFIKVGFGRFTDNVVMAHILNKKLISPLIGMTRLFIFTCTTMRRDLKNRYCLHKKLMDYFHNLASINHPVWGGEVAQC